MEYGAHLAKLVDEAFNKKTVKDNLRTHLGASVLGEKCLRKIWFTFHWCEWEDFDGRMLRLFNRGHTAEHGFAALLRNVGATVWTVDADGKQFKVSAFGGHVGGSMDGVAQHLPGLPNGLPAGTPVLLEMKTHNDKSFKELLRKGLQASKVKHYRQAQLYMHLAGLKWCLYCAVNKNDDALWFDFFAYDESVGRYLLNRAETVIFGEGLPPRISETPSWFECTFCPMKGVCFGYSRPQVNCRTCRHAKPQPDGTWTCGLGQPEIETSPRVGCSLYQCLL
jgi:hypothetical protein